MIQAAIAIVLLVALALPARAEPCPPPHDHGDALDELFAALKAAPDERSARLIINRMWELWADAPDDYAQELLDEGMTRRAAFDLGGALLAFDALIRYCPDYAEGYNQRAFVHFLRQDYEAALPDLDRALERSPRHLGALTGKAMTLVALGRNLEAARLLRTALELNPWLKERALLPALEASEKEL